MKPLIYNKTNFFVLTGGPGSGKTSLIQQLHKEGFLTINESARRIIQEQKKKDGDALPWKNKLHFAKKMLEIDMKNYRENLPTQAPVIFDRGIPDILGYVKLCHLDPFPCLEQSVNSFRYNAFVFILPPWRPIYHQDAERKQSFSLAMETYRMMRSIYTSCGYKLITIPKLSVENRANILLQHIKNQQT